jgi:hypothetical protein
MVNAHPQTDAEEAGKDHRGVGEVGRDDGLAVAVRPGHGELGASAEAADAEKDGSLLGAEGVEASG